MRGDNQQVSVAFADAQLTSIDLKMALLGLAKAYLESARGRGRSILTALAVDASSPVGVDAEKLRLDSYLLASSQAVAAGQLTRRRRAWASF